MATKTLKDGFDYVFIDSGSPDSYLIPNDIENFFGNDSNINGSTIFSGDTVVNGTLLDLFNGSGIFGSDTGNGTDGTHEDLAELIQMVATSIVLGLMILITVIGNVFVIAAIILERNLQNVANYLVASLAVADLFVACLVMPLGAVYEISKGWILGPELCDIWTSCDVLCCTASILHLVAIATDRFAELQLFLLLHIFRNWWFDFRIFTYAKPASSWAVLVFCGLMCFCLTIPGVSSNRNRYWAVTNVDYMHSRTSKRVFTMIFLVWFASVVVSLAPQFGWKDPEYLERIEQQKCMVSQDIAYQVFATCCTFYVPLLVILVLYWKIYQTARKRIHRRRPRPVDTAANNNQPLPQKKKTRLKIRIASKFSNQGKSAASSLGLVEGNSTNTVNTVEDTEFSSNVDSRKGVELTTTFNNQPNDEIATSSTSQISTVSHLVANQTNNDSSSVSVENQNSQILPQSSGSILKSSSNNSSCNNQQIPTASTTTTPTTTNVAGAASAVSTTSVQTNAVVNQIPTISAQSNLNTINQQSHLQAQAQLQPPTQQPVNQLTPIPQNKQNHPLTTSIANPHTQVNKRKETLEAKRERKAAKTLAIITGAFVVCWLPFFLMALLLPLCETCHINDAIASLFLWLGYFNSTLNPVIYTIFSPEFRQAFKRILFGGHRPSHYRSGKI